MTERITAQEIVDLAARLRREGALQSEEDEKVAALLQRRAILETGQNANDAAKKDKPDIRRYSTGLTGKIVNQYFSLFTSTPYPKAFPLSTKEDDESSEVENGLLGSMRLGSQYEPVWEDADFDFCWSGRGWTFVCRSPSRWGDTEYMQGPDEPDEDFAERYEQMKRDNFPIIWRYVDCRDVWPTFDPLTGEVDEVVEIKKLTYREVRRNYPTYIKPEKAKDEESIECVYYADRYWVVTAIGGDNPQIVREWKHNMGMNPYVLMEMPKKAPRQPGLRWQGVMYHHRDLMDLLDGLISDTAYNFKRATRAQPVLETDADSPIDAEDRNKIKIAPDEPIALPPGMRMKMLDPARTNVDGLALWDRCYSVVTQDILTPVLQGQLMSGTGANYNTTAQFAQRQHNPEIEALKRAAVGVYRRFLRSIELMDEPVPIFYSDTDKAYEIELDPKKVGKWGRRLIARLELSIPLHEGALVEQAILLTRPDHQLMPRETAMERYLRDENPSMSEHRIRLNRLTEALLGPALQISSRRFAQSLIDVPPNLQKEVSQLPAPVQRGLGFGEPLVVPGQQPIPSNGNIARGAANQLRAGQLPGEYDVGQGEPDVTYAQ